MAAAADAIRPRLPDGADVRCIVDGRIGQIVGDTYRISRHIGSGGNSHVFAAEHLRLGKSFAVKLLRTELHGSGRAVQRFRREARVVARLQSEHIVSVIDCGVLADQTPYLVMDLLQGEDLRSLLGREGLLPARRAVQIVIEACRGLTVVHEAGLVHRDLKPENLFITRRANGEDWCKVLDFGIAKMEASLSTGQGTIVGTARYMAPEQLSDVASVGPATDLYALGAVLYECLSGSPAQQGETLEELMFGVMNKEPRALSLVRPALPEALVTVVARCLAKRPSDRIETAAQLSTLLLGALAGERSGSSLTIQEADSVPTRPSASLVRQPWVAGAALLAAAFAGAAVSWSAKPNLPRPGVDARTSASATRLPTTGGLPIEAAARPAWPPQSDETAPAGAPRSSATPGESASSARPVSAQAPSPLERRSRAPAGLDHANPYVE